MKKNKSVFPQLAPEIILYPEKVVDPIFDGTVPINNVAYSIIKEWDGKQSLHDICDDMVKKYEGVTYEEISEDLNRIYNNLKDLNLLKTSKRERLVFIKKMVNMADSYYSLLIIHKIILKIFKGIWKIHNAYFTVLQYLLGKELKDA